MKRFPTYLVTPNDPRWHIETSWSRLTEQIAVPITFVVVLLLARTTALPDSARASIR